MITSPDNDKLKTIRKLQQKRWRDEARACSWPRARTWSRRRRPGWQPSSCCAPGEDVEPELLDAVSTLGSGTRVIGVYGQRWAEPGGDLCVYLHGVGDPGNVGTDHPLRARAGGRAGGARAGLRGPLLAEGGAGLAWARSSPGRRPGPSSPRLARGPLALDAAGGARPRAASSVAAAARARASAPSGRAAAGLRGASAARHPACRRPDSLNVAMAATIAAPRRRA